MLVASAADAGSTSAAVARVLRPRWLSVLRRANSTMFKRVCVLQHNSTARLQPGARAVRHPAERIARYGSKPGPSSPLSGAHGGVLLADFEPYPPMLYQPGRRPGAAAVRVPQPRPYALYSAARRTLYLPRLLRPRPWRRKASQAVVLARHSRSRHDIRARGSSVLMVPRRAGTPRPRGGLRNALLPLSAR